MGACGKSGLVQFVAPGYSGAGGRFPTIFAMPALPIGMAIGCDGRGKTGSELDSPCRPAHGEGVAFGAGTGGGGLLPQTAASGNVSQPDPESFMKYPSECREGAHVGAVL
jgi:hypothetical protein